jgi:hypothetical protein
MQELRQSGKLAKNIRLSPLDRNRSETSSKIKSKNIMKT